MGGEPLDEDAHATLETPSAHAFLASGGEMGARIRAFDWSKTALGPIDSWSPALRMQVSFLLANRFPILLWWGPTFASIYNDAYAPILGTKHPWALGRPVSECWSEIWDVLRPLIETPFHGGPPTWIEDFELEIRRHGFLEEGHFTVAYSPVPDETAPRGIGGVVATVHEISAEVYSKRRVAALRDLGARATEARTAQDACAIAAETLRPYGKDLPFVLLYLLDADGARAHLAGTAGVEAGGDVAPPSIELAAATSAAWPLAEARRREAMLVVEDLAETFADVPRGPWSDAPHTGIVVPIPSAKAHEAAGFLVAGVSPRIRLDESYCAFFELLRTQLAAAISSARSYEEEKARAEALAELDRAKTAFFSNVSHEFRTPLTLMLGPVEDLLARGEAELDSATRDQIAVVQRNGLRLLRLVNTLLDFSRIEAGRERALFLPTDLAAFTRELAGVFRAAIERAGLRLAVDCPPLPPVFVDREMWEKIVLNLLSNAFKFTLEGEVAVSLRQAGAGIEFEVRDTGTGIPAEEMPRLFERFHRVQNARARTYEGSGIGLALVRELVAQHGGSIAARSAVGEGTTFTVRIPLGSAHLPPDQIGEERALEPTPGRAGFYLEEARRGVADPGHAAAPARPADGSRGEPASVDDRPLVLVVDDNADMRQYVVRLLGGRYRVEQAADGEAALAAARARPPELVLSDVMMPQLDGFGLLRELRADARTRDVPVLLLSARAGEESRVEGLGTGADDYLTKPFGSRELLARVEAHLRLARLRTESRAALRESNARFATLLEAAPLGVYVVDADFRIQEVNPVALPNFGDVPGGVVGRDFEEIVRRLWDEPRARELVRIFRHVLATGESFVAPEWVRERPGCAKREYFEWRLDRITLPDQRHGLVCYFRDITAQVETRLAIAASEERYRSLVSIIADVSWTADAEGRFVAPQPAWSAYTGQSFEEHREFGWADAIHPDDRAAVLELWRAACAAGTPFEAKGRLWHQPAAQWRRFVVRAMPLREADGRVREWVGTCMDVEDREALLGSEREARMEAHRSARVKDEFLAILSHELRSPLNAIAGYTHLLKRDAGNEQRVLEAVEVIERNTKIQMQLVADLLDVSRIGAGKLSLRLEPVVLPQLVADALASVRRAADQKGIDIRVSAGAPSGELRGDPDRIQQIVWNLLSNAVKFTPAGGSVEVHTCGVRSEHGDEHVEIRVTDTGEGIEPHFLPHVFERFSQADSSSARKHGGLGLGLALVKQLTELHGGSVEAASAGRGRGATFTVRLPLHVEGVAAHEEEPREGEFVDLSGLSVLVVDDEADALELAKRVLEDHGAEVVTARGADEALARLDERSVDVILSDIGMPARDGYELLRDVRRKGVLVPAAAVTAFIRPEDRERALKAGYQAHLGKPLLPARLVSTVATLGGKRASEGRKPGGAVEIHD